MTDFYALISKDSPRAGHYLNIFGGLAVPIKSPIPISAELPGVGRAQIVEIAINELTTIQKERLATYMANEFSIPFDEVYSDLDEIGCPIRLDGDVMIEIRNAQKRID